MKHQAVSITVVLVLLFATATPVRCASLATEVQDIDPSKFPEVAFMLTVFSEQGRPVPGLTKDDFSIREDGVEVKNLHVEVAKAPCSVVLVVDTSGSMQPSIELMKTAVADFVRALNDGDRVALISFSDKPRTNVELTSNRQKVLGTLPGLMPYGPTAFYDAVRAGLDELGSESGRRFVVAFTDGQDQNEKGTAPQSLATAKQVVLLARERRVPLFTIGLGPGVHRDLLAKMARVTGGVSYHPQDASKLTDAFAQALSDFRQQYHVVFQTPKPAADGSERAVTIVSRAAGTEGQGKATYRAPAPPPPPPPAAGSLAVDASKGTSVATGIARPYSWITVDGFGFKEVHLFVYVHAQTPTGWAKVPEDIYLNKDMKRKVFTARKQFTPGTYQIRIHPYQGNLKINLYEYTVTLTGREDLLITPRGAVMQAPQE